ncbi:hypothetical protein SARC_00539 [Sphaeroforma arctica JP610]|uniref:beta-N-acetylhexosaminidase n=1 Tax=Sphaeroforma arctica JP610 TaxID=667725 RepID=A0A0L0GEN3_9EUKA|nr:hypothetical protein SARC_00539 [Sphaeroforma arctica JP610]KNC87349.1 hypothetical protein SARC_00539 [Sphaeroforma arctica JP610]|eukprot:XP_014161251.1 hypothetical protein SARC_00539 [Sphaeroforma arctica JP610]
MLSSQVVAAAALVLLPTTYAISAAELAQNLKIEFQVHDNFVQECNNADWMFCFSASTFIEYTGETDVLEKDWEIRFSSIRMLMENLDSEFNVTHTTGDNHIITPTDAFTGFKAGEARRELKQKWEYWMLFQTDVIPRWFVVDAGGNTAVIPNTDTEVIKAYSVPLGDVANTGDELVKDTEAMRFITNNELNVTTQENRLRVIPKPLSTVAGVGNVDISAGINLDDATLSTDMQAAITQHLANVGVMRNATGHTITVTINGTGLAPEAAKAEGYQLTLANAGSTIQGFDEVGAFYGVMTVVGLVHVGEHTIPEAAIFDAPRYPTRGAFVDVGRNFHKKDSILRLLSNMAAYKLNHFHFHLSDDEGFRLEIPGLPELTNIGSKRCHDPTEKKCLSPQLGAGPDESATPEFFTKAEFIEILQYANARGIEVIPEFDMPGHSRAAVVSMTDNAEYKLDDPEDTTFIRTVQFYGRESCLNPCVPGSAKWVKKIISELGAMYTEAGLTMDSWHYGGDEVTNVYTHAGYDQVEDESIKDLPFSKSPACQAWIEERGIDFEDITHTWGVEVSGFLNETGTVKNVYAWNDGFKDSNHSEFKTDRTTVNIWDTVFWGADANVLTFNDLGHEVVLSCPDFLYFDFPYERNPDERGYYWGARSTNMRKVFGFAPDNMPQTAEYTEQRSGTPYEVTSSARKPVVQGIQAQVWSEVVRDDDTLEHMMFPRLLAVAERAWHKAAWELEYVPMQTYGNGTSFVDTAALDADIDEFMGVFGMREADKLTAIGSNMRVSPPGIDYTGGILTANHDTPGAKIEADTGYGFGVYKGPMGIVDASKVQVRAVHGGVASRAVTILTENCACASGTVCVLNSTSFENQFICQAPADSTTTLVDDLAKNLVITHSVISNWDYTCKEADGGFCALAQLDFVYHGDASYTDSAAFKIHFSTPRMLKESNSTEFAINHVTGDNHEIVPMANFTGFNGPYSTISMQVKWEYWLLFQTDFFPRFYVEDMVTNATKAIANTDTEQVLRYSTTIGDTVDGEGYPGTSLTKMTPKNRFDYNKNLSAITADDVTARIVPQPLKTTVGSGTADISKGMNIDDSVLTPEVQAAVTTLMLRAGLARSTEGHKVTLAIAPTTPVARRQAVNESEEAYTLSVASDGSVVTAGNPKGLFYGIVSILSLVDTKKTTIPEVEIEDTPRLPIRGAFADVARNFHSKESILRLLDNMASYKLNHFHFHLSDDEGFRLEIPGLPELTTIGSKRCHDNTETKCLKPMLGYGPEEHADEEYFSVEDFKEILTYATARNIEVVPEFDMPGHSRAAVISMRSRTDDTYRLDDPEDTTFIQTVQFYHKESCLNPCVPGAQAWIKKIITEVKAMYTAVGVPLRKWHYGGDEVVNVYTHGGYDDAGFPPEMRQQPFEGSPACQAYIAANNITFEEITHTWGVEVSEFLAEAGVEEMLAWNDGLKGSQHAEFGTERTTVNLWDPIFWGADGSIQTFNDLGHDVILSCPDFLYFDFPQEKNINERGYYWASHTTSLRKVFTFAPENLPQCAEYTEDRDGSAYTITSGPTDSSKVLGLQGHVWSEVVRTDDQFEYQMFPRLIAVAERGWHKAAWELDYEANKTFAGDNTTFVDTEAMDKDFAGFFEVVGTRELAKVEKVGTQFRVPPPGVNVAGKSFEANTETPGSSIEYDITGNGDFVPYTGPVAVTDASEIAVRTVIGGLTSRVEKVQLGGCNCADGPNFCQLSGDSYVSEFTCTSDSATLDTTKPDASESGAATGSDTDTDTDTDLTWMYVCFGILGAGCVFLLYTSFVAVTKGDKDAESQVSLR